MNSVENFTKPDSKKNNSFPELGYEKPSWSTISKYDYSIEMLKGGQSIEIVEGPKKEFITLGRLPICDIIMEHPSISRYHAVIQFNQEGDAFIYDLSSAHGTRLNKNLVAPKSHISLKPGDQLRFGESTRFCIFDSQKPYDPESEVEKKRGFLESKLAVNKSEVTRQHESDQGATWGFGEDAETEEEDEDTQKRGDASLIDIDAEKKAFQDAKRRREDLELMYGDDSDEDFYDQTLKKSKKEPKAETHEELLFKQKKTEIAIQAFERKIQRKQDTSNSGERDDDDLDSYMNKMTKSKDVDTMSLFSLKKKLDLLKKENERYIKLVQLTKPFDIL